MEHHYKEIYAINAYFITLNLNQKAIKKRILMQKKWFGPFETLNHGQTNNLLKCHGTIERPFSKILPYNCCYFEKISLFIHEMNCVFRQWNYCLPLLPAESRVDLGSNFDIL